MFEGGSYFRPSSRSECLFGYSYPSGFSRRQFLASVFAGPKMEEIKRRQSRPSYLEIVISKVRPKPLSMSLKLIILFVPSSSQNKYNKGGLIVQLRSIHLDRLNHPSGTSNLNNVFIDFLKFFVRGVKMTYGCS